MTVSPDAPDYSRSSIDAGRRADADWQWGVTHTVRPATPASMPAGVEYTITVKVQRRVTEGDPGTTFEGLYARAMTIARARCQRVARAEDGAHHWVMCHAWRTVPAADSSLAFAMVMMGVMRRTAMATPQRGERAPTKQELMTSGGATLAEMQHRSPQRATEVLVEFDHRSPAASSAPPFMYSYGEHVAADFVVSFEPFVHRAEKSARAHQRLFEVPGGPAQPYSISHRQWYMASKLVTVELQLIPSMPRA